MSQESMRKPFIGGNWKCNGSVSSVEKLVQGLNNGKYPRFVEAVVAPVALHLPYTAQNLKNGYEVAAQNCSVTGNGAYTGEISAEMIKDFGLKWVILGHSERRAYYAETPDVVGKKVAIAQKAGLSVIACIGEQLDDRKADKTMDVVVEQLKPIGDNVQDWSRVVIAYEPVWAIGTGVTATPQQAQETHKNIREWISKTYGDKIAKAVRIIYGGSVKPKNCNTLWAEADIDGFLVGGASLKPDMFTTILNAPSSSKL